MNKLLNITQFSQNSKASSEGLSPKFWIEYKGQEWLFKYSTTQGYEHYAEAFVSILCANLGVSCVKSRIAKCDIKPTLVDDTLTLSKFFKGYKSSFEGGIVEGILVKSYLTPECLEEIKLCDMVDFNKRDRHDFDVDEVIKYVDEFCEAQTIAGKPLTRDPNMLDRLKELAFIDWFVCQDDRHSSNIAFLIKQNEKGEKFIELTPIFDNGMAFGFISEKLCEPDILLMTKPLLLLKRNIKAQRPKARLEQEDINVCEALLEDRRLMSLYKKIKQLDMNEIIKQCEQVSSIQFPQPVNKCITGAMRAKIDLLDGMIKQKKADTERV